MKIVKRAGYMSLFLLGVIGGMTTAAASAAEPLSVQSESDIAAQLGIVQGEGNGVTAAYLNKAATRLQGAIMSLRLQGLETEALSYRGASHFQDLGGLSKENQAILGYLSSHPELGWEGATGQLFNPLAELTAGEYDKVLLEALGYRQGVDFEFANVSDFAEKMGLTSLAKQSDLRNVHMVSGTLEALRLPMKGGGGAATLGSSLAAKGKLDSAILAELQKPTLGLMHSDAAGSYLTDEKGMTLYYFSKDVADPNACTGQCLVNWPVYSSDHFIVPAQFQASDFSSITRTDGQDQVTYKGWPLYFFVKDAKPGDTLGNNVNQVWFTVQPSDGGVSIGTKPELGNYLTDADGISLYYYEQDTKGVSHCEGKCLDKWPVFYASSISVPAGVDLADFGTLVRSDGTLQTTYKGYPLYHWVGDKLRGDTTGQDVGHVWYVIDPAKFSGTKAENASVITSK
ncbi:hypothetical protein ABE504_17450 [Paenibacillus oryzisoli]|uniref:hypothetical protein n=1 Tax=Paenibacillus oryzisoli TaxID=1850517 RepID=UPI003D288C0D